MHSSSNMTPEFNQDPFSTPSSRLSANSSNSSIKSIDDRSFAPIRTVTWPREDIISPRTQDSSEPFPRPMTKEVSTNDVEAQPDEAWKPQKSEWFIMLSLALLSLMVALDATILVSVLPSIATALHGSSIDAFWAGSSYLLSSAVFQPVIASISRQFGRQQLLLFSLVFFTIGTVMCAAANNFPVLLAGRSIKGIGGGGIITMSQVIFCDFVPLRQRPRYFSIVLGAWSIGSIVGPVVGGSITSISKNAWRGVFILNVPFLILGFILVIFFVKLRAVTELSLSEKLKKTDWFGAVLFVTGTTVCLLGLSWGGVQFSWKSAATLIPIIAGALLIVLFGFWQVKTSNSLLPMSLFYCGSSFAAFYCALCNGLLLFTGLYYVPFYSMAVRNASAIASGVQLFPSLVFILPGSIVVSLVTTRIGKFRWAVWTGWVITTIGSGLTILLDRHSNMAVRATALAVFGAGSGMVLSSVNFGIQAIAKEEDASMAASMYGFFRSLGMPIGVSIAGTIFQNAMSSKLSALQLPTKIAHESEAYVTILKTMEPSLAKDGIIEAYAHGFRAIWIFMTIVSATGLLASLFIKSFSMDKLLVSNFTARRRSSVVADKIRRVSRTLSWKPTPYQSQK